MAGIIKTVKVVAEDIGIWGKFIRGVASLLEEQAARELIDRLATLPVRSSHAVGLLGSYAHRSAEPLCIRLQPHQEPALLRSTLLHELAHACDHLTAPNPHRHRCRHGAAWKKWAQAFDISPTRAGHSPALRQLREERLKPVAVCERCGCIFHRLRRLPARRHWVHPECGNGRVVPWSADK